MQNKKLVSSVILAVAILMSAAGCQKYEGEIKLTGTAWIPVVDKNTGADFLVPGKSEITLRRGVVVIRNGVQKLKLKLPKQATRLSDDIRTLDLKGEATGQPVDIRAQVTGSTKETVEQTSYQRCSISQTYLQPSPVVNPDSPGEPYRFPGSYYNGRFYACDDGEVITHSTFLDTTDAVRLDFTDIRKTSPTSGKVLGSFETSATDRELVKEESGPCLPIRQYTQPCYY